MEPFSGCWSYDFSNIFLILTHIYRRSYRGAAPTSDTIQRELQWVTPLPVHQCRVGFFFFFFFRFSGANSTPTQANSHRFGLNQIISVETSRFRPKPTNLGWNRLIQAKISFESGWNSSKNYYYYYYFKWVQNAPFELEASLNKQTNKQKP